MRFQSVTAYAFGPFVDRSLSLAPGMNVIHGPNEAGKSTWHAALWLGLCGVRRGRGARTREEQQVERYHPWDRDDWEVGALITLADGRAVELRHDLAGRVRCRAVDATLGRDYSDEIISDGAPDGSRWLGLNRRSFLATACVRQADLLGVLNDPNLLQDHLQRAVATSGADATAAAALERLRRFQSEQVGLERSTSIRPLRQAHDRVHVARQALAVARAEHAEFLHLCEEVDRLAAEHVRAQERWQGVEAARAERLAREQGERLSRARELVARYPEGAPAGVAADDELARDVAAALRAWEERPSLPALSGESAEELRRRLDALPLPPVGDLAPPRALTEARDRFLAARQAVALHLAERPPEPAKVEAAGATEMELRDLARDLEAAGPELDPADEERLARAERGVAASAGTATRRRGGLALAGVCGLAGAAALASGALIPGAVLLGLALAALAWSLPRGGDAARLAALEELRAAENALGSQRHAVAEAERRRAAARARAETLGLPVEVPDLRRLAGQLVEAAAAARELARWQGRQDGLAGELTAAEAELAAGLRDQGVPAAEDLAATWSGYESACRQRAEVAARAALRPELEQRLAGRQQVEAAAVVAADRQARATRGLRTVADPCGLGPGEDDALAADLRGWLQRRTEDLQSQDRARAEWAELESLLAGGTLQELEEETRRREDTAARLTDGLQAATAEELEPDLEAQAARLDRLAREAAAVLDQARGQMAERARALGSVPEAEEEVVAAEAELARVQQLDRTLGLARQFLESAQEQVHRDIAPVLAASVERWLPEVTAGRYRRVRVDPATLEVQVCGESGRWRQAARLSHGTAEQIYLLLRVALAEHLTSAGEVCPLVLDDVTVQFDDERQEAVLRALQALSRERQVILFSQEREVVTWAEAHLQAPVDCLQQLDPAAVPA